MKQHKNVTMKTEFSPTPNELEWIVGYLPGPIPPTVISLICDDCKARWSGTRQAWSKLECIKQESITLHGMKIIAAEVCPICHLELRVDDIHAH